MSWMSSRSTRVRYTRLLGEYELVVTKWHNESTGTKITWTVVTNGKRGAHGHVEDVDESDAISVAKGRALRAYEALTELETLQKMGEPREEQS
ncbi:MAG: hypothetical protein K0U16_07810 [Gammaproteobacteria bacterium]|nr:hypothetical protein [Gammaproteobacteria bacterium]